ncbi:hypothetical protein E1B28_011535 [Marasmius oreades]|uniref:F-box domain-containing protein n=1 Tax=Marasmius oreades TaxID=181124 RepID=A0A9P7RUX9_9AGAR|nr:uncharacterized protein E1B28_011535 [Marasmius oreades]KAG7089902.1 hypothetical protein E1B28_011535 [Marasmius oreades]
MADAFASLAPLEEHIKQLQGRKMRLLTEVEQVEQQILLAQLKFATLSNEAAPISRLPDELLTSIFALTRQEDTPRSKAFQVVASHVCAKWRAVATTTPLLWSEIQVILTFRNAKSKAEVDTELDRLNAYLTRSNSCIFSLKMEVIGNINLEPFLQLLGLQMYRCQRLSFSISNHSSPVSQLLHHFGSLEAPILQHLSIHIPYCRLFDYDTRQLDLVRANILQGGAPALQFLRVTGIAGHLQPPLSRLTTLHLDGSHMDGLSFEQFRDILQSTPEVINLSLNDLWVETPVISSPQISIPNLRCLRIRARPEYDLHSLLINLPVTQLESCAMSQIASFRPIEFTNVKSLTLEHCSLIPEDVGNLILGFPAIQSLTLVSGNPSSILFALGYPGTPIWWPKLKLLFLNDLFVRAIPIFLDAIHNRQATETPLERLYLDRETRKLLRSKKNLEEVNALLPVENHEDSSPWPAGLGYEDEDDGFWY